MIPVPVLAFGSVVRVYVVMVVMGVMAWVMNVTVVVSTRMIVSVRRGCEERSRHKARQDKCDSFHHLLIPLCRSLIIGSTNETHSS